MRRLKSGLIEMKILNRGIPVRIFENNQACITIAKEPRKH